MVNLQIKMEKYWDCEEGTVNSLEVLTIEFWKKIFSEENRCIAVILHLR